MSNPNCPEREECMSLAGAPMGMYHCSYCFEMILAGEDPSAFCEYEDERKYMLSIEDVAKICHQANKAYCETQFDKTQPEWYDAPQWQVDSAIKGVKFCLDNPDAPASANHESWLKQKIDTGWKYGPVKNTETKEHPCCVPYENLSDEQKAKDYLFKGVVESLRKFVDV